MRNKHPTIYISGKMTGALMWNFNYFYESMEEWVSKGYQVFNPAIISSQIGFGHSYEKYLVEAIKMLLHCNEIYMLDGWKDSRGARVEHFIAVEMKIKITYQKEN